MQGPPLVPGRRVTTVQNSNHMGWRTSLAHDIHAPENYYVYRLCSYDEAQDATPPTHIYTLTIKLFLHAPLNSETLQIAIHTHFSTQ